MSGSTAGESGGVAGAMKRLFDLALVTATAPLWLPAIAVFAVAVRLALGRPVFFEQPRPGQGGRIVRLWKLRSMVHDADARLAVHLAANPEDRKEWAVGLRGRPDIK